MSAATDIAELEAAITEAELNDEEAELAKGLVGEGMPIPEAIAATIAEREPDETPPPAAGAATEELGEPSAKTLRELERQVDKHLEKVRTIMGGHVAAFEACGECGGVGLVPPGPRPQEHPDFKECEVCNGFGQVKTGSLREGHTARDCPTCRGRGYLERLDAPGQGGGNGMIVVPVVPMPPASELSPEPPPAAPPAPAEPQWGVPSWMGDPNVGQS